MTTPKGLKLRLGPILGHLPLAREDPFYVGQQTLPRRAGGLPPHDATRLNASITWSGLEL